MTVKIHRALSVLAACLWMTGPAAAQTSFSASAVPPLVRFSGTAADTSGNPMTGVAAITFALYAAQTGGEPLWSEKQSVQTGAGGRYTVLLGVTRSEGLPADLFTTGDARWLGVSIEGQPEQERALLVSVPYAMKAQDADTIGGLPPSAFELAAPAARATLADSATKTESPRDVSRDTACTAISSDGTATANQVGKFTAPCQMEPSAIFESGGKVGIGTTTPAATLDVKGTATLRGALTINANGAATSAAGANSNPLDLLAASYDSTTLTSISQHFRWQAEASGNGTASPAGTLNLLYAPGTATPAETGLMASSQGRLTFAAGQTFPGVGTITGVTTGTGLTGGGTSGTVGVGLTTTCASHQVLHWNGSAWVCASIHAGTVTGVTAGAGLSGGGASGNITLANTGVLSVAAGTGILSTGGNSPAISLNAGLTDGRYLSLSGGTLAGPLSLPANGLTAASNQLVLAGGNVGIGTATPGAPLQVAGNLKISGAGSALTFPDGTTQATAGSPGVAAGVNSLQVALLKWFPVYQSASFTVGPDPCGVISDGANIWVTNQGDNTVTKLQASTGTILVTSPVGTGPCGIAFDGANIWVANFYADTVTKLLASNGSLVGTYPVGTNPNAIAFDGANIWVANYGSNNVTKLLASNGSPVNTYSAGTQPHGIAFDGANIWVANFGSNNVTKLLASSGSPMGTYTVGSGPYGIAFDGANIWVTNFYDWTVSKLQASTGAPVATYPAGPNPAGIVFDGTYIWLTDLNGSDSVNQYLASTGVLVNFFYMTSNPLGLAFDGANIWVTIYGGNTVNKL